MDRFEMLRRNLDKDTMTGIEIGPFYNPVAPRADGWNTIIVDYQDGEALRQAARSHTAEVVRNKIEAIEDVDIVWTGEPLDQAALEKNPGGYDFLIASHVIEHTPDILSFLQQSSRLLKPDGIVSLAVPDMRKCFDLLKMPTSRREILAAYREQRTRHTPETLFEARAWAAKRGDQNSWLSGTRSPIGFTHPYKAALESYKTDVQNLGQSLPYVDAHAWFFTPASFELAILELNAIGLLNLKIAWMEESHGSEFIVQMRRAHRLEALSEEQFNAERIRLTLRHFADIDRELAPDYRDPKPVEIVREFRDVSVPAPPMPTREMANLLIDRLRRKLFSALDLSRSH